MSGRGINFLENWLQQDVTEGDKKGSCERATELGDRCIADAAAKGLTIDGMEPEWASVETIIYKTTQNDMDAELEYWKVWVALRDKPERLH